MNLQQRYFYNSWHTTKIHETEEDILSGINKYTTVEK